MSRASRDPMPYSSKLRCDCLIHVHLTPPCRAMALLRTLYLVEMFALQLVPLFGVLSAAVSQAPDARVITDVSVQRSWLDALQVRDARRHVARRKAPRFMMELYEETLRNPAILHANIVRSFPGA